MPEGAAPCRCAAAHPPSAAALDSLRPLLPRCMAAARDGPAGRSARRMISCDSAPEDEASDQRVRGAQTKGVRRRRAVRRRAAAAARSWKKEKVRAASETNTRLTPSSSEPRSQHKPDALPLAPERDQRASEADTRQRVAAALSFLLTTTTTCPLHHVRACLLHCRARRLRRRVWRRDGGVVRRAGRPSAQLFRRVVCACL